MPVALGVVGFGWAVMGVVHGLVVLAARVVRRGPPRVGALAVTALVLVGVVPASFSSTGWLLAATFVLGCALCGTGVALLDGPQAEGGQRLAPAVALATGVIAVTGVALWVAAGGSGEDTERFRPSGSLAFELTRYGSGEHPRRVEFAEPDVVTATVDGSPFLESWVGVHGWLRSRHWGFGRDRLPLNATVWLPQVEDPVPLVLVAHGNHSMYVPSDLGHAWLAEELASHGYAVASVDQNFLNDGLLGFTDEYDARAWLLLEHLRLWRDWQTDPTSPFHGRVDLDRIALIGHSRGGEAVAHAALFDTMKRVPDIASVDLDAGFGIDAVVALAPMDGAYRPAGRATRLHDVSYLTVHPGRDGDHPSFYGLRQYERTAFTDGGAIKAAVYLEDANHAQFNAAWGRADLPGLAGRMLDTAQVMPGDAQRRDVAAAVLAFLDATLRGDRTRLAVLHEPTGPGWSGATRVLTRFADSSDVTLADFAEDTDPATGTLPGTRLSGSDLTVWREEATPVRGGTLDANSVVLAWDHEVSDARVYTITPQAVTLPADPVLLIDVAEAEPGVGAEFTVRTRDAAGTVRSTAVAAHGGVPPAPQPGRLRPPLREALPLLEPFGQTLRIPLRHDAPLIEIHVVFDRAPRGSIRIDRIAIGSDATGGLR